MTSLRRHGGLIVRLELRPAQSVETSVQSCRANSDVERARTVPRYRYRFGVRRDTARNFHQTNIKQCRFSNAAPVVASRTQHFAAIGQLVCDKHRLSARLAIRKSLNGTANFDRNQPGIGSETMTCWSAAGVMLSVGWGSRSKSSAGTDADFFIEKCRVTCRRDSGSHSPIYQTHKKAAYTTFKNYPRAMGSRAKGITLRMCAPLGLGS